jgi:hypothetical protein
VHERDTGSPEYQIAALTERVNITQGTWLCWNTHKSQWTVLQLV